MIFMYKVQISYDSAAAYLYHENVVKHGRTETYKSWLKQLQESSIKNGNDQSLPNLFDVNNAIK